MIFCFFILLSQYFLVDLPWFFHLGLVGQGQVLSGLAILKLDR